MGRGADVGARAAGGGGLRPAPRPAAVRLIDRHGDELLATARRYTLSREDAEDAYQRALEILLTKAPPIADEELLRWTKTVVKHEAFAIWRTRERSVADREEPLEQAPSPTPSPDDQVQSYERLRMGAEAIRRLKPQEIRCLLLRAEGYSYRQICELTGWSYTKVNRCLTEGRRSFLERVARIESGAECERLSPLLSRLADGEATATDLAALRPHLRSCLACRATLRDYRDLPHQAEALMPVLGGAAGSDGVTGVLPRSLESLAGWAHDRAALVGMKLQAALEGPGAGKLAAVAASTVALAGGTVALRSLGGGPEHPTAGGPPHRAVPQARPAALVPSLPEPAVPAVTARLTPPPPQAGPLPAPAPAPSPPALAPQPAEPPRELPERVAVPIREPGESALEDPSGEERTIDPMTEPVGGTTERESAQGAP